MNQAVRLIALQCGLSFLSLAASAAQAETPVFKQGVWEFERTSGASKYVAKECIDPSQDMRQQDTILDKMGCKRSSAQSGASVYTTSAECTVKLPSGFASWTTTSTLTMESDSAYRMETRTVRYGRTLEEVTTAHRVGDCGK
jgi:hypothetical protein